ncbi:MAG: lytic murein transglycosylase [Candidatus Nomurabacteria bacterium]|nr:lytic murein transglycosylase [Candidatus Nomurabacteria bacterium]
MKKTFFTFFLRAILIFSVVFVVVPVMVSAQTDASRRAKLEAELAQLEAEIAQQEITLAVQKANSHSIQGEVDILASEIKAKRSQIQKKNSLINELSRDIGFKQQTISELHAKEGRQKDSLAQLIRKKYEVDGYSVLEFLLSGQEVSEFLVTADDFTSVNRALKESFDEIRDIRGLTEIEKKQLEERQTREADLKNSIEADKRKVEKKEDEQEYLLQQSQAKEKTFEQILAEREAAASKIRAQLFELVGIPDGGIPFGEAYQLAKEVSAVAGIDPAFLLAIATQETGIGKNVGTCNRTGDSRHWDDIMPGPGDNSWRDDQTIFLRIVSELGLDPNNTPLSCPFGSGWGGAMGPMQFIPATWDMFDERIEKALGVKVANPWNPRHAFMASSMYLADLGATRQTFTSEREAACKYYSGRGCSDPKVKNLFYGNSVMAHKKTIQTKIDIIEGN